MFVPQAGKTAFNQSTFILIIPVSFAVWCPCFETEETKNKQAAPGKENMHQFTPLCLSVLVGPRSPPHPPTKARYSLTHPHKHIRYGKGIKLLFTQICERWLEMKTKVGKNLICAFKSWRIHVINLCVISPLHCHMNCCCSRLSLRGHCAG